MDFRCVVRSGKPYRVRYRYRSVRDRVADAGISPVTQSEILDQIRALCDQLQPAASKPAKSDLQKAAYRVKVWLNGGLASWGMATPVVEMNLLVEACL